MGTAVERFDDKARRASTRSDAPRCIRRVVSGIRSTPASALDGGIVFSSSPCFPDSASTCPGCFDGSLRFSAGDRWLEPCIPVRRGVRVFLWVQMLNWLKPMKWDQGGQRWMRNIGNYVAGTENLNLRHRLLQRPAKDAILGDRRGLHRLLDHRDCPLAGAQDVRRIPWPSATSYTISLPSSCWANLQPHLPSTFGEPGYFQAMTRGAVRRKLGRGRSIQPGTRRSRAGIPVEPTKKPASMRAANNLLGLCHTTPVGSEKACRLHRQLVSWRRIFGPAMVGSMRGFSL